MADKEKKTIENILFVATIDRKEKSTLKFIFFYELNYKI